MVYCATRRQSEEVAEFLQLKDWAVAHYHAGLPPETKKDVQRRFIVCELRAIAATNAFGMGIDKPDVRLVVHANIPGSLENYLQEAGRAGRDREPARCVLLYAADDVERQFGMSARSRLSRVEIQGILRALRKMDRKKRLGGEVIATAGEILGEDEDKAFERDSATDDTRVRTAVAWLEEAQLLTRKENVVQIFPSSLRVSSIAQAEMRLAKARIADSYRSQLLRIAEALIEADADEGVSTDELMEISGLSPKRVRAALYDLERLGIANNDTVLAALVHAGVERASLKRLREAAALETALIAHLRGSTGSGQGKDVLLHLRIAAQALRDRGLSDPLPERLWRIIRGISYDGRGEDGSAACLTVRKRDAETVQVTLQREWEALEETATIRREAAERLLEHLLACLPSGSRGTDLLAETTLGKLLQAIEADMVLKSRVRNPDKLLDRALLWLHEQEVIRLNKGLTVFRPAMAIRLAQLERRGFSSADFAPLALHYKGQVLQVHVMMAFAECGLEAMREALRLAMDYFTLKEQEFLARWLPDRDREIGRETTLESWRVIVESLKNPVQQRIVADSREQKNVLVLAGPGSGKTRVLVHRIAYLIRARRESARGILALTYNRHAAIDIRRRLTELIGDDARGVTVLTCHALAMRLAGASFTGLAERPDDEMFREVLRRAADLLHGEGLPPEDADERRERLLAGFRWILVDEYQDIGPEQYALISALAGRTLEGDASKLTLFAVGDDDQNVYAFTGASVDFIRRFKADYGPSPVYLTANYRSTGHIIAAANAMIAPARERMKAEHPIRVNWARTGNPPGGAWEKLDPVSCGRVQILPTGGDPVAQAQSVMTELQRIAALDPDWDWSRCAVIAREWKYLVPVRAFCEMNEIPVQMGNEEIPGFWRLRETRAFVDWLRGLEPRLVDDAVLRGWIETCPSDPWHDLLRQAIEEHALERGGGEIPIDHFIEWLAEMGPGHTPPPARPPAVDRTSGQGAGV
nr:UvrD-helicase domain-containing protein [Nitratireductor sp. XY-223]